MNERIGTNIRKSSEDFLKLVWPVIGPQFGEIIPVETVTANSFARELDARAGIDNWLIGIDGHMRGLASRVQWTESSYDTFTIRIRARFGGPTEYHKRKKEIATDGALTPHYVCHAYVSTNRLRLVAVALGRMRDIIAAIDDGVGFAMRPNGDGTQGWALPWQSLLERNVPIEVWPPRVIQQPLPLGESDWPEVRRPPDWRVGA